MNLRICLVLIALATAARAAAPVTGDAKSARKVPPAIVDGAKMFSAETKEKAQKIISNIRKEFEIDVCFETVQEYPDLEKQSKMTKKRSWLRHKAYDMAENRGVNGLFVLIVKEPVLLVSVVGWPVGRELESYTSNYKRRRLGSYLEKELRRNPDKALIIALTQYQVRLVDSKRLGDSPLPALPALILLGGLTGLWLLVSLVRGRLATGRPAPIYQPGMQGSLFGVPAGFWVYDRLFQAERPSPTGVEPPPAPVEPSSPPPGEPRVDSIQSSNDSSYGASI